MSEEQPMTTAEEHHANADDEVSLLDILTLLARNKGLIFKVTLAGAILASIILFILPNQYTAETVVIPPTDDTSTGMAMLNQMSGGVLSSLAGGSLGVQNQGDMYLSLFESRTVEDGVIHQFGLMDRYNEKRMSDTRKSLERHATITLGVKDGLIRIDVTDRDPQKAADIANGFVEQFRKLSANLAITDAGRRRLFFEKQLQDAKEHLTQAEVDLQKTEQKTGIFEPVSQAQILIESAASLRAQVVAKEVQIQSLRAYATNDNPDVVQAQEELSALQAQLNSLHGSQAESPNGIVLPKGKLTNDAMDYLRKYRDFEYNQTLFELLAKQLEMAKLDEARQGNDIQVADKAVPPDDKSSPHRLLLILLSTFLVAVLTMVSIVLREGLRQAQQSPRKRRQFELLRQAIRSK